MLRVNEVKSKTATLSWRYIPGYLNPADDATRPVEFKELHQNWQLFNGPEFLNKIFLNGQSKKKHLITLSFRPCNKLQKWIKLHHY